ncbi:MAG: serine-rich protein [Anaerolineae bacterium]
MLDYLWYYLEERLEGHTRQYHKAVCLNVLTYLPREVREQTNIFEKTRKALKGLYNAGVDLVHLYGYLPGYGQVQIYGAQAISEEGLDKAVSCVRQGMAAVRAVMANFEQSRLAPLDLGLAETVREAFRKMPMTMVVIGHPDPREGAPGMSVGGPDPFRAARPAEIGLQQKSYLMRGMSESAHPYLGVVILSRAGEDSRRDLFALQERVAMFLSILASQEEGTASSSIGFNIPVMASSNVGDGASAGYGSGHSQVAGDTVGRVVGTAHTESQTNSQFWSKSHTTGEAWGTADTSGSTWSQTVSHTTSVADGTSRVTSEAWGTADTHGSSVSSGSSWGNAVSITQGASMSQHVSGSVGFMGTGLDEGYGLSQSIARSEVSSFGGFSSSSSFNSHTGTHSWGVANGTSHTVGSATTVASSAGGFSSHTNSHVTSVADTTTSGGSRAFGVADTTSTAQSVAHSRASALNMTRGQSLNVFHSGGLGVGIAPFVAFSRTHRVLNREATMNAEPLRQMERMIQVMAVEGAYYADHYFLCETPEAYRVLEALIPQAYHGTEGVAVGIRCRHLSPEEQAYIRKHAFTFTPSSRLESNPFSLEPWKDTTLMTMRQASAYTAPVPFEEGVAITTREQVPPLAFVPDMPGRVVLGHQYSYERSTEKPTDVPVRMARELMANWAFCADTRMGKSVAAERLVFELVMQEGFRVVVMDYGAGWTRMLTALPRDRVDFWSLAPWAPRPIRWNFLQIGKRISPREQMTATVELICTAGRMGERQAGFMLQTLEELYIDLGVLTFDGEVQNHDKWGLVQDDEWTVLDQARQERGASLLPRRKTWLRDMEDADLQALAVHRSKKADAREWYERLSALARVIVRDTTSKSALEGVKLRLQHLTKGQMGQMYGAGDGAVAIEDLVPQTGGLTILSGGARMSAYARAALLSLMTYHLYTDSVVRREERLEGVEHPPLFIVLEEANKVLGGDDNRRGDGPPIQSDIIPSFFRDAGKYMVYLAAIAQSPASLPAGILSSCNNLVIGQLKNPDDVREVMSALARSPHGFVDVPYAHFIGDLEVGQMIIRLGLARGGRGNFPILYRPLMVHAHEPSPSELEEIATLLDLRRHRKENK